MIGSNTSCLFSPNTTVFRYKQQHQLGGFIKMFPFPAKLMKRPYRRREAHEASLGGQPRMPSTFRTWSKHKWWGK